jgi:hypothetical protein
MAASALWGGAARTVVAVRVKAETRSVVKRMVGLKKVVGWCI